MESFDRSTYSFPPVRPGMQVHFDELDLRLHYGTAYRLNKVVLIWETAPVHLSC